MSEYKTSETYTVKIYISGSIQVIEQVCREECLSVGLCVTVEPTKFIYTGGEENGAVIGLINYPRFPKDPIEIKRTSINLANRLLLATFQHSVLIMTPEKTEWITNRIN